MKKLMILSAMAVSGLMVQSAKAQIGIHINLHLGGSPVYEAPEPEYADQYYYLPDVEAYYSVRENCYYYNNGYNWVSAAYLPGAYRNYDWHYARRIEIREPRPYLRSEAYRSRYGGFEHRNWNYRDEHDNRMYADRDHNHYGDQYRGHEDRGYARPQEQHNDRGNYGRMQEPQHDDRYNRGQQAQPQQNDNRGNGWNNRGQQQAQPQQNDNRGNGWNGRGQQAQPQQNDNRGNDRGGRDQQQAQPQQNNNRGNYNGNGQHFAQNTITDPGRGRPVRF